MGSKPILYKYPIDRTGINPNNLIIGEPHTLMDGSNRVLVPNYGAFFTESLVVKKVSDGAVLMPQEQYVAAQLYQEATQETGKEICAVVIITDTQVTGDIQIDYQVLGGEYSYSVNAIREALDDLDLDYRPVQWGDIIGKPSMFAPSPHLHDAGDLYGFEYLVEAIENVRDAIYASSEPYIEELREYVDNLYDDVNQRLKDIGATTEETLAGESTELRVTPEGYREATNYLIKSYHHLMKHETYRLAHGVTKETIGVQVEEGVTVAEAIDVVRSETAIR